MATPHLKVYTADGEYVAAVRDAEDAAAIIGIRGDGATIRYDHKWILWTEGLEAQPAGDSYDYVAEVVAERLDRTVAQRAGKGAAGRATSWRRVS